MATRFREEHRAALDWLDARTDERPRFAAALARKADLETACGRALSFEPLVGKKGCRIGEYRAGGIEQNREWKRTSTGSWTRRRGCARRLR